jgi:hypothetical protein
MPLFCDLYSGSVTPFNLFDLPLRDFWALKVYADAKIEESQSYGG